MYTGCRRWNCLFELEKENKIFFACRETLWTYHCYFFYHGATAPVGQRLPFIEDSLSHSFTHTTVERNLLDAWSIRCTNLYLTTHNTHKWQTSMPPARFEPAIPASERPQTHALDRAATGIGCAILIIVKYTYNSLTQVVDWRVHIIATYYVTITSNYIHPAAWRQLLIVQTHVNFEVISCGVHFVQHRTVHLFLEYSDTLANENNSFRNHIR
jgi:hypothetical protein